MTKTSKILSDTIIKEMQDYVELIDDINLAQFTKQQKKFFSEDLKTKQKRITELYENCDPLTKNIVNTFIYNNVKKSNTVN